MKRFSPRKLNAKGFAHHFLLPVVAVVLVCGIGYLTLHLISAASSKYYGAACAVKGTYTNKANGGGCVKADQELLDGLQHAKYKVNGKLFITATKVIANQTFAYGKTGGDYLIFNGTYNGATQSAITTLTGDKTVSTLNAGTSASADTQILCNAIAKSGIQLTTNANNRPLVFNGTPYTMGSTTMASAFATACGSTVTVQKSTGSSSGSGSGSTTSGGVSSSPSSSSPGRFGISLGGGWQGYSTTQLNTYFADMQSMGVQWVRFDINWVQVQPSSGGSYNWSAFDNVAKAATAHNLKVLAILDQAPTWAQSSSCAGQAWCPPNGTSNYAAFASAAATHYAPLGVTTFEIWNEENQNGFWINPNAANYTALLKAAYTAIHNAEPGDFVVSGGVSPGATPIIQPNTFVQQMYADGAKGYFDALGIHPYCFSDPSVCATSNSSNTDVWGQMAYGPNNIKGIMQANGDGAKQIWMTEFGDDNSASEAAQEMKSAFTLTNGQAWAGPIFWYDYIGDGSFGLLNSNGSQTAAYQEYKALTGK